MRQLSEENYTVKIATFEVVRENAPAATRQNIIDNPEVAADIVRALIPDDAREHFGILMLSSQNKLVAYHEVSSGTLTASLVHPREVFGPALRMMGVSSLILVHNHPSGDVTPSKEDLSLTRQLVDCGKLLGVTVHDHIIIGNGSARFVSLHQRGMM